MNWEKACEMMDSVESDLQSAREKLRYLCENLESLNGKQDSLHYGMQIKEEFIGYVKFQISTLNNILNYLDTKADNLG